MADKITTVLWFDHVGEEAANFYVSLLPDSRVDQLIRSPGDNPSGKEGDVLVVDFTLAGRKYSALNGGSLFKPNESVSFMIVTEDQEETDRLWNAIVGNGGQESACGWCKDKWGYSWQITPRVLLESLTNPDKDAARRAHEAMMQMKKIDVAAIEAAIAG
ncbi:MAG: VOC family protein [Sphingomonadales bacterium]|nr:MAG: VOC family protein [Sphingomonadales bacterium]